MWSKFGNEMTRFQLLIKINNENDKIMFFSDLAVNFSFFK